MLVSGLNSFFDFSLLITMFNFNFLLKYLDKYNTDLVSQIADHYLVSKTEAIDYVELMPKDSCSALLSKYGYNQKEIKTMLKGKK